MRALKKLFNIEEVEPNWIQTFSGKSFTLPYVNPQAIDIVDIAHALAMTCRYSGHSDRFYSVARHSVEVSKLVPDYLKLMALLHDSSEAYLTDIPGPFKDMLPGYRDLENIVQDAIYQKFGVEVYDDGYMIVHEADKQMLHMEASRLGFTWANKELGNPMYILPSSNPEDDKAAFMAAFARYTEGE